jgi:hypothetical protein
LRSLRDGDNPMTHTVDTLMALAYKIRDARTYDWDVSEAVEAGNTLRAALTEALAQPVLEPAPQEQIQALLDDFMDSSDERLMQFARDVEKLHGIGGDK